MEYIIIGIIVATIVFMLSGIRVVNQLPAWCGANAWALLGSARTRPTRSGANLSDDYDGRCSLDADRCAEARGYYER